MRRNNPTGKLVPVLAVLLALVAIAKFELDGTATAQQPDPRMPFNAAEQRKQILEQLKRLDQRMAKIEAKLDTGISVRMTEMPPIDLSGLKD